MKVTAYKVVSTVLDFENMGKDEVIYEIENTRYCMTKVNTIESSEIEEWEDDHPLNHGSTYDEVFSKSKVLLNRKYNQDSWSEASRDVDEAFSLDFTSALRGLPTDEDGFVKGTFKVTVEWTND